MCLRTYQNDVFNSVISIDIHKKSCTQGFFYVEMMGLIGAGNNPMVGMTVAVAVAIEEASK